jgi:ribonucleoside-triphosphate reductase
MSFSLPDSFIEKYKNKEVDWGFKDAGSNSLGELTFIRTYSRVKEDGTKEQWWEVCKRVIDGMYSIQKDYVKSNRLPWNDRKAQASAQEAYDRMFTFKWTPPGRGLWMMGTDFVMKGENGGAALQNCAFVSTADIDRNDPGFVFSWVMDALMLGVGVGWDTKGKDKNIEIQIPDSSEPNIYVIPDSREGWANSVRLLINSYLRPNQQYIEFDYSDIRPYGAPINGFGGTASGPDPLEDIHIKMREIFESESGQFVGSRLIADLMNLIGTCVVAGNVRRSAEIGLGDPNDEDFINLKNAEYFPERNSYDPEKPGWGWMSNNTLSVKVGQDYSKFTDLIATNGEPGFIWMDMARSHGRLADPANNKDRRVAGINPCAEQTLESFECCTLVEVHINRAESKEDFLRTLKFAYLYGKTITLLSTHWDRTNAVMQRNRRIGASVTGVSGFYDVHGLPALREWWNEGYEEIQRRDHEYSEWLGIRESVKTTSIKPSGTVSLLSGATPGVHWPPGGKHYLRAIRFASDDPMVPKFMLAGYTVEQDVVSRNTVVVYFPIETQVRGEKEVSIFEKINLASEAQRHWADNAVSATISFDKKLEAEHLPTVLNMYEGKLKTISFLPMGNDVYQQQPYTEITEEQYNSYVGKLQKIEMSDAYLNGKDAEGERYCSTATCDIKAEVNEIKGK